jgi:hypothetical protein
LTARCDSSWSYAGHPLIRMENEFLSVDVLPGVGGKVLHLIDKQGDRNVLWRNPRVMPRRGPMQADVDDYFSGGWDDAFPTGDPCTSEHGDALPYMGEIWNSSLSAHVQRGGPQEVEVVLDGYTPITPARWTRTLRLRAGEPLLHLETRIENVGYKPFAFIWGSHPSLSVHEGMRLDVPAAAGEVTDSGSGELLGDLGERYDYPWLRAGTEGEHNVRLVPGPEVASHALHALTGLSAGWVAATDPVARRGFGVVFDADLHRCVWQWMAYGGFRGWYHAILEPWTAPQPSLADAAAAGQARTLQPGGVLESQMTAVVYSGLQSVGHLDASGAASSQSRHK